MNLIVFITTDWCQFAGSQFVSPEAPLHFHATFFSFQGASWWILSTESHSISLLPFIMCPLRIHTWAGHKSLFVNMHIENKVISFSRGVFKAFSNGVSWEWKRHNGSKVKLKLAKCIKEWIHDTCLSCLMWTTVSFFAVSEQARRKVSL